MPSCGVLLWVPLRSLFVRARWQGYETLRPWGIYVVWDSKGTNGEPPSGSPGRRSMRKSVAEVYLQVSTLVICWYRHTVHSLITYWYTSHCPMHSSCHVYLYLRHQSQESQVISLARQRVAPERSPNSSGTPLEAPIWVLLHVTPFLSLTFPNIKLTPLSA
jgi:hypothetical protein